MYLHMGRGELQIPRELGEQLLRLAHGAQNPGFLARVHGELGLILRNAGEFLLAREHVTQGLALYDPQQHRSEALLYGYDPEIHGLSHRADILWMLGYPNQALEKSHAALTRAQALAHPFSLGDAFVNQSILQHHYRKPQPVKEHAEALLTLAAAHGFPVWSAWGTIFQGWRRLNRERATQGLLKYSRVSRLFKP